MLTGQPTIVNLVDEIKNKNIFLPMIQRPFVWLKDEERITKLFDSVIKKFPIGIILLYQKPKNSTQIFGRSFFDRIDEDAKFEAGFFSEIDLKLRYQLLLYQPLHKMSSSLI